MSGALRCLRRFGRRRCPFGRLLRDLRAQSSLPETTGYFPDSGVAALDRFGQTAAVGSYPTHALHGSDEGGSCAVRKMVALALLHPNFPVRSVMAPGTFHPPHDVRTELRSRSPFQTCRSHSSSALNGLLQSQKIRRSPCSVRLLPAAAST